MNRLTNQMRLEALRAIAARGRPVFGPITSYSPVKYCAKVNIQPDNIITGWLPIKGLFVGPGWGLFCGPRVGAIAEVNFQEDDSNAGYIGGMMWSNVTPPLPVPSGEAWLVHQTGSFIKLLNDGSIASKGVWNHAGSFHVAANGADPGAITATGDITDHIGTTAESMLSQRQIFNTHTHFGVQTGSGNTGTPNQTE